MRPHVPVRGGHLSEKDTPVTARGSSIAEVLAFGR